MMPSSKIVLPSSDAEEYNGIMLRSTISRIVNPTRAKGVYGREIYKSENCPSWWPKDVLFSPAFGPNAETNGIALVRLRKVLAAFLEKCPEQYTILPPVDQQNSALTEYPAVGTKRARMIPGSKIVFPSSDVKEYSGNILQSVMLRIANSKGWGKNFYTSDNCPSWWPKDVVFAPMTGHRSIGIVTSVHRRKVLAAFLEKCPEQYTISHMTWVLNPPSSPLVGVKQPVREVSPQSSSESYYSESSSESSSESDQEEPDQTPPTRANRTRSVGATISTAAQHASPKLILPSSYVNDYSQLGLISLIRKILNAKGRKFKYSNANCPSWWPTDVPFIKAEGVQMCSTAQKRDPKVYRTASGMKAKDRAKVLTAFLNKCPEQYTILPPVDQQNSTSTVETDQPEDTYKDRSDESDSDPEDLVNSLEQHLLDSRKRRLEAERKVEELTEEIERLKEERKFIGSIVKRSRLHH